MENFLKSLEALNTKINGIIWGPVTLIFILFVGLWLSIKFQFFQFLKPNIWLKTTFISIFKNKNKKKEIEKDKEEGETKNGENKISSFQALSAALSGSIGTGNIVGVATSISIGGPGALFWMVIAAFFGMMTSFVENALAIKHRTRDKNGQLAGGPMIWIDKILGVKWLAYIFAFVSILVTFGTGNMIQSNGIASVFKESFGVSPFVSGIIISILAAIIIFGGIKRIIKITDKVVPTMVACYLLSSLIIIICNLNKIGSVFHDIISNAFDFRAVGGSIAGCAAISAMKVGISRGVFSNEAGLGTAPIIHAVSNNKNPVVQGMWGMFGVFIDTILICSATGLSILVTIGSNTKLVGVQITKEAFSSVFGWVGTIIVYSVLVLFAFTTIIGWSYIGERGAAYVFGAKSEKLYKAIFCIFALFGAIINLETLWNLCDNLNALMMIPNLITLLLLSKEIVKEFKKNKLY